MRVEIHADLVRFSALLEEHDVSALVELELVREDLGLFSDTSQDDLIKQLILTAVSDLEKYMAIPFIKRQVTDYFPKMSNRLVLSQYARSLTNVELSYVDADGTDTTLDYSSVNGFVDYTKRKPALILPSIPDYQVSGYVSNPISVSYDGAGIVSSSGATSSLHEAFHSVKKAVMYYVNLLYYNRGGAEGMNFDMKHIHSLLDPWRNLIAVPVEC